MTNLFHHGGKKVKIEDKTRSIKVLKKMATTKELRVIFNKIENENIPSVRNAWIDYFLEIIKHPKYHKN